MKILSILMIFLTINLWAQTQHEDETIQLSMFMDKSFQMPGVGASFNLQNKKQGFNAGLGSAGNLRRVGFVDVVIKNQLPQPNEKLRIFYHYSPIEFNSSALFERVEAFLKMKVGVDVNTTSVSYSFSPISGVRDRELDKNFGMIMHGLELKQKIGDLIDFETNVKWGQRSPSQQKMSANYFNSRSEIGIRVREDISIIAFYDIEKLSTLDPAIADTDRAFQSQKMNTIGGGFRFDINNKSKRR